MIDLRKTAQDLRDTATWLNNAAEEIDRQGVEMDRVMPLLKALSTFASPVTLPPVAIPNGSAHPALKPNPAKEAESRRVPGLPGR